MKRILLFTLLLVSLGANATSYTWNGGTSGSWGTTTNWSPNGTPGGSDDVTINTPNAVITMPTSSFSLGKLIISNTTTLQTSATITITVGNTGFSSPQFYVASGKTLNLQTTGSTTGIGITILVATGYTGSIDGNIVLGALTATSQAHKIMHQSVARGVIFNSGSSCSTSTVYSGSTPPFSTSAISGVNNNVTFASGSTFNYYGGQSPFGSVGPYVEFQSGSNYVHYATSTPSIAGRTFGNFTINASPTTPPASITGGTGTSFENLTISQGSWALTTASGGATSGTFNISKDITVASGATLTFGNVTAGINSVGTIINFTGATQTLSNSGTIAVSAAGTGTGHKTVFNVNSVSSLTINTDFDLGASNADAKRNLNVLNGGSLTIGTGKTFTVGQATLAVNSGGNLTINNTATLSNSYSVASTVGVTGNLTNNGVISGQGLINLNGAATQTISGTGSITNLTISNSITNGISFTSGTQSISGALTNGGTITGAGIIKLNGTATTVSGTGSINNLTVANGAGNSTTISSGMQNITGTLLVSSGTLTTGGFLTLKSTSIGNTAVVDQVSGPISGNVIVERFIPKGFRAYRDIAPGVYNAITYATNPAAFSNGSIFTNWQENGSYSNNGYGVFITGTTATQVGSTNAVETGTGLDRSIGAIPSIFTQVGNTPDWNTVTIQNTQTTLLNPFQGYRVLVRGDRSFNIYTQPIVALGGTSGSNLTLLMVNPTTLRTTGSLITGNVNFTTSGVSNAVTGLAYTNSSYGLNSANATTVSGLPAGGYSLIANPYVCPVDWGLLTKTNIQSFYYYFDPTVGSSGSYVSCNSTTRQYIQPGQAIFIQNATSGSPSVSFTEGAKAASSTKTSVFGTTTTSRLPLSLLKQVGTTSSPIYKKMDIADLVFNTNFSNNYGNEDAPKFTDNNSTENLFIKEGNYSLGIDGRTFPTKSDVIALVLSKLTSADYQLRIDGSSYQSAGVTPYIYDSYKKTTMAINSGINTISFSADTTIAASFNARFSIVFKAATLPVNSITVSPTASNNLATITWNTIGETNVSTYTIEESTDGISFTSIGEVAAKNTASASYSYIDNSISEYYRIKVTNADGSEAYSNIATLTTKHLSLTTYNLYPNPLKGKVLNVQLTNVSTGKYTVSIYNNLGAKVSEQTINHNNGTASHTIAINSLLASGVYTVNIHSNNQLVYKSSLSIQP